MQLSVTRNGDVRVARVVEAKLTYPVLADFAAALRQVVEDGARKLVVDFGAVVFIDSPAIGCLMDLHRQLVGAGGTLKLAGLQRRVETLLALSGIFRVLEAHGTTADAVNAFAARDPHTHSTSTSVRSSAGAPVAQARFAATIASAACGAGSREASRSAASTRASSNSSPAAPSASTSPSV